MAAATTAAAARDAAGDGRVDATGTQWPARPWGACCAPGPAVDPGAAGAGAAGLACGDAVRPSLTRVAITASTTRAATLTIKAMTLGSARPACSA
jgi:hypothetical protein